MNTRL